MSFPLTSSSTCNTHNVLRNISIGTYAVGIVIPFRQSLLSTSANASNIIPYAIPALQECCLLSPPVTPGLEYPIKENLTSVYKIPGNTGCEVQYCLSPSITKDANGTVVAIGDATGGGTLRGTSTSYDDDVYNCINFISTNDLPSNLKSGIAYISRWGTIRMYDDELPMSQVFDAVIPPAAPAGWVGSAKSGGSTSGGGSSVTSSGVATSTGKTSDGTRVKRVGFQCSILVAGLLVSTVMSSVLAV